MNVRILPLAIASFVAVGCADAPDSGPAPAEIDEGDYVKVLDNKGDASAEAIFLDFEFSGELLTSSSFRPEAQIEEQMLFVEERQQEKEELRAQFGADLERYRELKAN